MALKLKHREKETPPFLPQDLEALTRSKGLKNERILPRLWVRKEGRTLMGWQAATRILVLVCYACLLLMGIAYGVSALITYSGNFTVSASGSGGAQISLSEAGDFFNPTTELKGAPIEGMDNITYAWLPKDLDKGEGIHNGENYIAYSFHLRSTQMLSYIGRLEIIGASKGIDEAIRVMIYCNGVPTIYAKPQAGSGEPEPGTEPFFSAATVAELRADVETGQTDKYTVVIWLEGEDPECVDRVKGGVLKMRFNFAVEDESS